MPATVSRLPPESTGTRVSVALPMPAAVRAGSPLVITEIAPTEDVAIELTNLLVVCELSQPQLPGPGGEAELPVWKTSEIVVRHCEAASTTSETFALTV